METSDAMDIEHDIFQNGQRRLDLPNR